MIYVFQCPSCSEEAEFTAKLDQLSILISGAHCIDCGVPAKQVLVTRNLIFARSPFPKGYHEHISADGAYIRDKYEARDVAAENGLTSKFVENMDH